MKKYTIFLLLLSVLLSPTRGHRSPEGRGYLVNIFSKCLLKCLVFVFSLYVFFFVVVLFVCSLAGYWEKSSVSNNLTLDEFNWLQYWHCAKLPCFVK